MNQSDLQSQKKEILRMRAARYAQVTGDGKEKEIVDNVVVLAIGEQKIGVPVANLEVIGNAPPIAHLPEMPSMIRGVLQNRGELIAAVDTARLLGLGNNHEGPLLAVVTGPGEHRLGLLVDRVLGFREITADEIAASFFDNKKSERRPVKGTTRDLVAIIDMDRLFAHTEISFGRGAKTPVENEKGLS